MGEQVKLLLSYDVRPGHEGAYRRFVLEELIPRVQELGLMPTDAWHTAYGDYPNRLLGFVADDADVARNAMASDEWAALMGRLEGYVSDLSRRLVLMRGGFQW